MAKRGSKSLVVLVGYADTKEIQKFIQNSGLSNKFETLLIPSRLYQHKYTTAFIDTILTYLYNQIAGFKKIDSNKSTYGTPASITIAYAPFENFETLINVFSQSCNMVESTREELFKTLSRSPLMKIDHIASNSHLLLPFHNFYIAKNRPVVSYFPTRTTFPVANYVKQKKCNKRAFQDARKFYFEISNDHHGSTHLAPCNDHSIMIHRLEGLFRFGAPIHENHHYHVKKTNMQGSQFTCQPKGDIYTCSGSNTYLNITSNDSVR